MGKKKAVNLLIIDFKKTYDSLGSLFLYNSPIEFRIIRMKLVRLIKLCLSKTCIRVRVDKNLYDTFPIRSGLKHVDALSPLLSTFLHSNTLVGFR